MSAPIEFYFACVSPWSYLGLEALTPVAAAHGRTIDFRPIEHGRAWAATGAGRPLPDRPAVFQSYRLIELPRWAAYRGVPINVKPRHFPTSPLISSRTIIAARQAGTDVHDLTRALMRGCWVDELDIGDPGQVIRIADGVGLDGGGWSRKPPARRSRRNSRATPTPPSPGARGACRPSSSTASCSSARTGSR